MKYLLLAVTLCLSLAAQAEDDEDYVGKGGYDSTDTRQAVIDEQLRDLDYQVFRYLERKRADERKFRAESGFWGAFATVLRCHTGVPEADCL